MKNIIIIAIIIIIIIVAGYIISTKNNETTFKEADVVIDISGKSFEYNVSEIKVKEGDVVTINFTNEGGFHDWVLDEFSAATEQVSEGEEASVTFIADQKGVFEYYCSVGDHRSRGMVGKFIVE